MRFGVWLSTAAVVLLTVATALRTAQVEGASRIGRRLPSPSAIEDNNVANPSRLDAQTTFKSRGSRRREETPERDVARSRIRSRPTEGISETPPPQGNNERFDSRRTSSRTRSRPADDEIKTEPTVSIENIVQGRTRQVNRRPSQTTQIPFETSSPTIDVTKIEIINSNLNDISRIIPKEDNTITSQFRRRSSSAPIIINTSSTESINPKRPRGRVNTRTNLRTPDLDSSGTTNSISVSDKEPTTARTGDLRNGRKLRHRTRQSETDTNLTGEGLTRSNEIMKSSQNRKKTSQQEIQTFAPIVERLVSQSTEANKLKTTTLKVTKVIRRPLGRGIVNKQSISKTRTTEEINDDDNYPPSFKAFIQTKNASTQASSPIRESLSVKASQKVYNTYTPSVQSTQTGPAANKYSRLRKQKVEVEKNENKTTEKVNETTQSPETSKPKDSEYRPRGVYSTRNKKSTVFTPSSTTSSFTNLSSGKIHKYNRKIKVSTTESSTSENVDKDKQSEGNLLNKPFVRPPSYPRKLSTKNITISETSTITNRVNSSTQSKITLPRTSYYSRLRTNIKSNETSTTEVLPNKNNAEAQKKIENTVDMPLIFTLLKNPDDAVSNKDFIVNVNSKELQEKNTINQSSDMTGESENMAVVAVLPTMSSRIDVDRHKYHANYKDQNPKEVENKERTSSKVIPLVRNLQTRKYGRKRTQYQNLNEDNINVTSQKPRERNIRKFSDVYSKTTEASSNGIAPEPERPKSRFSSKYRASNVDKPFYKPTVPTITSSTVEGEEIQLGPDLNAISFTQTRKNLSSADLRLSESLVKQSHVMNVEASQHSLSVTVSIFDALAEILTSTPRTGLSSTTEVTNKPILNTDESQILNGISSSALNIKSSSLGITTGINKPHAEKSTASHVLSLRTTTILPSIDEILLNSISSAAKQEMVISSMTSSTREPRILTLDIDPETKQIRTEKPNDGEGNAIFKFIPIDEVTVSSQNSNVLKLASTRTPTTTNTEKTEVQIVTATSVTESNTQTQQIQTQGSTDATTTTAQTTVGSKLDTTLESTTINVPVSTTELTSTVPVVTTPNPTSTTLGTTTMVLTTTSASTTITTSEPAPIIATPTTTTTTQVPMTTTIATVTTTTEMPTTSTPSTTTTEASSTTPTTTPAPTTITSTFAPTTTTTPTTTPLSTISPLFITTSTPIFTAAQTTTISIEEDLKKYQEDLQLLQTLLQATGRDPKNLNLQNSPISLLSSETTTISSPITKVPVTSQSIDQAQLLQALLSTTIQKPNTLLIPNIGVNNAQTTTERSIEDDIRQFEEDTKLLKALLQATGQNPSSLNIPTLDNIRTTTSETPTTTTPTTTPTPTPTTTFRQTTSQTIAEDIKQLQEDAKFLQALLKATGQQTGDLNLPIVSGVTSNVRIASNPQTTSIMSNPTTPIEVRPVYTTTTQAPIFKTFAPRTISPTLQPAAFSTVTEGMGISTTFAPFYGGMTSTFTDFTSTTVPNSRPTPNARFTVTTDVPSTSTFSVEEDLAFLKNLKNVLNTNPQNQDPEAALANRVIALAVEKSLKEIQSGTQPNSVRTGKTIANSANNIIATTTTTRPTTTTTTSTTTTTTPIPTTTTIRPITTTVQNGPSIEDDIRQFQEDTKLLQALIKATGQDPSQFNIPTLPNIQTALNGKQETTTQKSKLITGQTSDEALLKLIQQTKPTGMISEATVAPISLSTEYGKSNDALLAALLKEQGFGPTTASSLDEQLRLAALLNQVVVTPKARRTTTPPPPPPPPPAPRRPILDGLAWLWQQWRETAPGPETPRPNRKPVPSARPPAPSPSASSGRVNWFGSGPFVGNADDRPGVNRVGFSSLLLKLCDWG